MGEDMLVGYTFQPQEFLSGLSDKDRNKTIKKFIKTLRRYGVLYRPSCKKVWGEFKETLYNACPNHSKELKHFFKIAFTASVRDPSWVGISDSSSAEDLNKISNYLTHNGWSTKDKVISLMRYRYCKEEVKAA